MPFPHQNLKVYQKAREFNVRVAPLIALIRQRSPRLADQLERAGPSMPLNIAEGATEFRPKEKARLFRLARRECAECDSALESAIDRGYITAEFAAECRALLEEISKMLLSLIRRFGGDR